MHRTVRLNETNTPNERVAGTVAMRREEQLGVSSSEEHKTFHKASRWGHSRAATGCGAGCARCGLHEHGRQQRQAPPDMMTGQSIRTCLRREVPTDHEAHSQTQRRQLRRVATTELRRECTPEGKLERRARSRPHSGPQRERTRAGRRRRAGATNLWKHGPPRTEPGGRGEWCWLVQQTTHSMRRRVSEPSL